MPERSTSSCSRPRRRTIPFRRRAVAIQAGLGITHGAAFDLQAVCSGFVYALATADGLLKTGAFKRALVIGAETFSRILDWTDRGTCVLFGDGAGAVVLEAQATARDSRRSRHPHLASALRRPLQVEALCRRRPVLDRDGRASAHGRARGVQARRRDGHGRDRGRVQGDGLRRRRYRLVRAAPGQQAHHRRLGAQARASRRTRWSSTVDRHGNTSAASIPLALVGGDRGRPHQDAAISCCSRPWAAASPGAPLLRVGGKKTRYSQRGKRR